MSAQKRCWARGHLLTWQEVAQGGCNTCAAEILRDAATDAEQEGAERDG